MKRINNRIDRKQQIERLQSDLGYGFRNRRLLSEALTHPSYAHARPGPGVSDNQRLEFFGDAVLSLIISDRLIRTFPDVDEGSLTRMRSSMIATEPLARLAESLRLGRLVRLSRGEEKIGGRTKKSVLAGTLEALVAAIYMDGGIDAVERLADRLFGPLLETRATDGEARDYKTQLQELAHSANCRPPLYILNNVTGPDHDLLFTVTVIVGKECFGRGTGKTRREAEQSAAREGILLLEEELGIRSVNE